MHVSSHEINYIFYLFYLLRSILYIFIVFDVSYTFCILNFARVVLYILHLIFRNLTLYFLRRRSFARLSCSAIYLFRLRLYLTRDFSLGLVPRAAVIKAPAR